MTILGDKVINRTENWKTARVIYRLYMNSRVHRLAELLLANHKGVQQHEVHLAPNDIHVELFWRGTRDYLKQLEKEQIGKQQGKGKKKEELVKQIKSDSTQAFAKHYESCFGSQSEKSLRKRIEEFNQCQQELDKPTLRELRDRNYNVSGTTPDLSIEELKNKLFSNLMGTEIDIVLESRSHLFVGEAKDEMDLGSNGSLILVHQLIRQYVMARILVCCLVSEDKITPKTVVPFVVRNKLDGREQAQVDFMKKQGWLKEDNVLTWEDIENR